MRRYRFRILDEDYNGIGSLPDGSNKRAAVARARDWMKENRIASAKLEVTSMRTGNLIETIGITL